ncbi:biliverdin-producing heme oxygenase PigA, partial [Pseudomonas aeruginosa]
SLAEALGWLFVSEGSKLGAAFLFKKAAALELDENFGARHLAEPEGGRAQGWKSFVAILDGIELNEEEERLAAKGASDAFNRFGDLLERTFA